MTGYSNHRRISDLNKPKKFRCIVHKSQTKINGQLNQKDLFEQRANSINNGPGISEGNLLRPPLSTLLPL